jgi:hypothetical protein
MPGMRYKYDNLLFPSLPISSWILIRTRFDLIEEEEEEEGRGGEEKGFFQFFSFLMKYAILQHSSSFPLFDDPIK